MRKSLALTMVAITFGGAIAVSAPAQAQHYRHHNNHNRGDTAAAAVVGGIAGLAIGAALAGSNNNRGGGYYDGGYYAPRPSGYYAAPRYAQPPRYAYRTCVRRERVYDPYLGRRVMVKSRYAC